MAGLLAFVGGNWTWLLPVLLLLGVGVDDGLHRVWYAECQTTVATDKQVQAQNIANSQAEVRKALQADVDLGNTVVAKYAGEIAGLQGDLQDARANLAKAQDVPACSHTGVTDAFDSGVQQLWDRARKADPVQIDGSGRNQPAVPAPDRSKPALPR